MDRPTIVNYTVLVTSACVMGLNRDVKLTADVVTAKEPEWLSEWNACIEKHEQAGFKGKKL